MATRYGQPGTSAPNHKPQIFRTKDVRKCLPVMEAIIQDGKPVAIDAEGINLSAEGRMTLLQICTWDGRIYLLDLIDADHPHDPKFGRKLLENGRVKAMLESSRVEKVTHSCSNDISALHHQFDIRLDASQIFDTQAADQALQTLDGTVFPKRSNLAHLAEEYGTPAYPLKDDHGTWLEKDKEAWGRRPLSKEMINHACYNVRVLIPELYNELKRLLDQKSSWPRYWQISRENSDGLQTKIRENSGGDTAPGECGPRRGKMGHKQMGGSSKCKVPRRGNKFGVDIQAEMGLQEIVAMDVRGLQSETQIETAAEKEQEWKEYQHCMGVRTGGHREPAPNNVAADFFNNWET